MQEAQLSDNRDNLKRAEWGVVLSLIVSGVNLAWTAGVVWQSVQDHDRRIAAIEVRTEAMAQRIERIDANVQFLAERAKEDRDRMEREK